MRAGLQKIVFIQHNDELLHALEEKQILNTTIRDLVSALRKFGMKRFKKREIIFVQKVWDNHISTFNTVSDDASLIKKIADKIFEEDASQTIKEGHLVDIPAKLDSFKPSLETQEAIEQEKLTSETVQTLRHLLLEHAHIWLSSPLIFLYTCRKQKQKQIRSEGETCFAELKGYLETGLIEQNIYTEKKFLVLIYLLVKLSSVSTTGKSELNLGPDVGGWRSYACQSYGRIGDYEVPKKTNIYATQKI